MMQLSFLGWKISLMRVAHVFLLVILCGSGTESFSQAVSDPSDTPATGESRAGGVDETTDPLVLLWQRAVDALDESYDQWKFRPAETVDSTTFTINYIASLATDGRRRLDRVMILHADPNRDRAVTRNEAMSFLESQIGLKWISGDRLRLEDGRVLVFAEFLRADTDQDDRVSQKEFVVAMWDREDTDADFSGMDLDDNGFIEIHEYADHDGQNYRDVLQDFDRADIDQDLRLTRKELLKAVPIHRRHLLDPNLVAFDDDGDGQLSLREYRLSMLGNYNYPWELMPEDDNLDDQISFDEFQFHPRDLFQLQKRYYFHRLDLDHDGFLSADEFPFQPQRFTALTVVNSTGQEIRRIFESKSYPQIGSPVVRPAGKDVLFHAVPPEGEHQAVLMLLKLDGSESREISHGLLPSWSPSGDRFTCSRYKEGASVWIMGLDGNARGRIDDGWGAQWSPDGRWIAYRNDNGIRLYDTRNRQILTLLDKRMHGYRYLHPFFNWASTGDKIALFASTDHETELIIVSGINDLDRSVAGRSNAEPSVEIRSKPKVTTCFRTTESVNGELSWDERGVFLFSMFSHQHGRKVIYRFDPTSDEKPKVFEPLVSQVDPSDIVVWGNEPQYVITVTK